MNVMQRWRDFGVLSHRWHISINPLLSIYSDQKRIKHESSGGDHWLQGNNTFQANGTHVHMNLKELWHKHEFILDRVPTLR